MVGSLSAASDSSAGGSTVGGSSTTEVTSHERDVMATGRSVTESDGKQAGAVAAATAPPPRGVVAATPSKPAQVSLVVAPGLVPATPAAPLRVPTVTANAPQQQITPANAPNAREGPPQQQQQQPTLADPHIAKVVNGVLSLLQTYGPLTHDQLYHNIPPAKHLNNNNTLQQLLNVMLVVGVINLVDDDRQHSNAPQRYAFLNGLPRPPSDIIIPSRLFHQIKQANHEIDRTIARIALLRNELLFPSRHTNHHAAATTQQQQQQIHTNSPITNPIALLKQEKNTKLFHERKDNLDQRVSEKSSSNPISATTTATDNDTFQTCLEKTPSHQTKTKSARELLKTMLLEYPEIAYDPVYCAALRNFNVDVAAVDRERERINGVTVGIPVIVPNNNNNNNGDWKRKQQPIGELTASSSSSKKNKRMETTTTTKEDEKKKKQKPTMKSSTLQENEKPENVPPTISSSILTKDEEMLTRKHDIPSATATTIIGRTNEVSSFHPPTVNTTSSPLQSLDKKDV